MPLELSEWRAAERVAERWTDNALRGGFPALANDIIESAEWLGAYVSTYLERDVRQISQVGNLSSFRLSLELCAARSG